MKKEFQLTQEGVKELQAELDRRIRENRRPTGAAVRLREPGHVLVQPDQQRSALA